MLNLLEYVYEFGLRSFVFVFVSFGVFSVGVWGLLLVLLLLGDW